MPFGSAKFLREATMPAVRDGLAASGRAESGFAIVPEIILSAGEDHDATRRLLAFYGSTPAYRPVLDIHGWGDLQPELNAMSKQGRWQEMAGLITDEVLHTIAACGTRSRSPSTSASGWTASPTRCACISPGRSPPRFWPRSSTSFVGVESELR
jgi:hypothetical protein